MVGGGSWLGASSSPFTLSIEELLQRNEAGRLIEESKGAQVTTYGWDSLEELTTVNDGTQEICCSSSSGVRPRRNGCEQVWN